MEERVSGLLVDLYELSMLQGYQDAGIAGRRAVFDLSFRQAPFDGGFAIAAGLEPAIEFLEGVRFSDDDIDYLRGLGSFREGFLASLRGFRFTGDADVAPEGTPVFPHEPILQVRAPLGEAQVVETALLNIVNFQTLIATKAARVVLAASSGEAPPSTVVEFGFRRAQGPDGAMSASRAAMIGGCAATSNVLAAKRFGIPVRGTQAHSWIMSFPSEIDAFRAYTATYPDSSILLVDTYDTLGSGLPNAITAGRELRARGHELQGIRLDSGDLLDLSRRARRLLDEAGLTGVKILASGDLDEEAIAKLRAGGAPIDAYGVGTRLVVAMGCPALSGVYKLAAYEEGGRWIPCRKDSDSPAKGTLPGVKTVHRRTDASGIYRGDLICLEEEIKTDSAIQGHAIETGAADALYPARELRPLLLPAIRAGRRVTNPVPVMEVRERTLENLSRLPGEHRRLRDPEPYPVHISPGIARLRRKGG